MLLLGCFNFLPAQINLQFTKYLKQNNLSSEYYSYINSINTSLDSISFLRTDYFMITNQPDSLIKLLKTRNSLTLNDTLITCEINKFWLKHDENKNFQVWFDSILIKPKCVCDNEILFSINRTKQISKESAKMDSYFDSYNQYKKAHNKKPLVAATLSAIVPGLGKWYIGKPKVFLINFIGISTYFLQTFESGRKVGWRNAYTIFMASFGSIFYLSNIYGSYNDTKILKKEKKHIYLHEANVFYSDYFSFN